MCEHWPLESCAAQSWEVGGEDNPFVTEADPKLNFTSVLEPQEPAQS